MKIHNASSVAISFTDLRIPAMGVGQQRIAPGADALVFDEDAEKSNQLKALLLAGTITKVSDEEPNDGSDVDDASAGLAGALLADGSVAMTGDLDLDGNDLLNAPNVPAKDVAATSPDVSAVAAADAAVTTEPAAVVTAVAAAGAIGVAFNQAEVQAVADLANDLKAKYDASVALTNELKSAYDGAVTLINELKGDLAEARALANELKGIVNNMNA